MNKKLLSLIVALCTVTGANADIVTQTVQEVAQTNFPKAAAINAKSELYSANPKLLEFKDRQLKMDEAQAIFERQIQTGFFVAAGAATTLFVGCLFAEWLQEFKVRKAEKAKLIAELEAKAFQIKAACR